tara:strand:+ start:313 stop:603 length:291 start_codon:yes stop_codon:yes gene_type:complete
MTKRTGLEPTSSTIYRQNVNQVFDEMLGKGINDGVIDIRNYDISGKGIVPPNFFDRRKAPKEIEDEKQEIFGIPKLLFFGGVGAVALIGVVFLLKR